ncbi:hypothetical protein [Glycomyces terrestris]|uniref:DUF305 domain-containing protein n=1 Tax=Glycomyces terrestris TaxID=2493553 RepID=A0A426V3M4_9ACTN|nr:hypothetical protein [Glycomyces terrestris]RRS01509.1 hypothetical protein EIW28_01705 [Glycomyces terrestris]
MNRPCNAALMLTAFATAMALSACAEGAPPAGDTESESQSAPETSAAPSPTAMSSAEAAEAFCTELSSLLTSAAMLELGFADAVVAHGPGDTADMVPDPSAPTAAYSIALDSLMAAALAPDDLHAHLDTLSEAGTAMTEAMADGASLADLTDIWYAPEVKEAEEALRAYDESTCG